MLSLVITTFILFFFYNLVFVDYFILPNTYKVLKSFIVSSLKEKTQSLYGDFFFFLIIFILVFNMAGNIPGLNIPSLYYFITASLSLTIWVSLMIVVYFTQLSSFLAHMLPYGSPSALMLFLPLVEIFSHIIRPFTLMVRLSTNLSSGHIMLFMFSYFALSLPIVGFFLPLLLLLELMISALQAYIFASLSLLYISETL